MDHLDFQYEVRSCDQPPQSHSIPAFSSSGEKCKKILARREYLAEECKSETMEWGSRSADLASDITGINSKDLHWTDRKNSIYGRNRKLHQTESVSRNLKPYQGCESSEKSKTTEANISNRSVCYNNDESRKRTSCSSNQHGIDAGQVPESNTENNQVVDLQPGKEVDTRRTNCPELVIVTFNCYGFNEYEVVKMMTEFKVDILSLQETWAFDIPEIDGFCKLHAAAMKPSESNRGRPYGGVGMYIRNSCSFRCLSKSQHHISIVIDERLTIHNLYLPAYDTRFAAHENLENFVEALGIPSPITCDEIFAGDFNVSPYDNNARKNALSTFFADRGVFTDIDLNAYQLAGETQPCTFISQINGAQRLLDRVVCSSTVSPLCTHVSISDEYRKSDHFCVKSSWQFDSPIVQSNSNSSAKHNYTYSISRTMKNPKAIKAYIEKANLLCKQLQDKMLDPEALLSKTVQCLKETASNCFPKKRSVSAQKRAIDCNLIGYNDIMLPLKNDVNTAYRAWKIGKNSSSRNNLWRALQAGRRRYARQLGELRRTQDDLKYNMCTLQECHTNLKQEKANIKTPHMINGVSDPQSQVAMWTKHLQGTLNCYGNDKHQSHLLKQFATEDCPSPFHLRDVIRITQNLDPTKAYENHILWRYAPTSALINLTNTLNELWVHGKYLGAEMWNVLVNFIPKSAEKDLSNIKSWRPISVGSTECFILEKLIVNQLDEKLVTSDNQFAYKREHGCEMPIKLLRTLNSKCKLFWALFLDASAAFDKISHSRIRRALRRAKLTTSEINRVMYMLGSNVYRVVWCNCLGEPFMQTNGVKQGGGLSDKLFALCYEDIIESCQALGPSVGINNYSKISILLYADDIVLLSFSFQGVIQLYHCVCKWSSFDINFNEQKSHLTAMGKSSAKILKHAPNYIDKTLEQNNVHFPLNTEGNFKYLGVFINEQKEMQARTRALYAATNRCCCGLNFRVQKCSENVRRIIFKTYIYSAIYCLSCFASVPQALKNAYRFALFKFFGNCPHINTKNINNITTRTSTMTVNARVLSLPELHRKSCYSLHCRMLKSKNNIAADYAQYALHPSIFLTF